MGNTTAGELQGGHSTVRGGSTGTVAGGGLLQGELRGGGVEAEQIEAGSEGGEVLSEGT